MIRVLLAEDQAMVRGALSALLSLEEDIEVIAEVGRGDEVVPVARSVQPDVALPDIEMPGARGALRRSDRGQSWRYRCTVVPIRRNRSQSSLDSHAETGRAQSHGSSTSC